MTGTVDREIPPAPEGLTPYAIERWGQFWVSPQSLLIDSPASMEALTRWAEAVDERHRAWRDYLADPVLPTVRGGYVINPSFMVVSRLDKVIIQYENHFGMTPLAQLRLGIDFLTIERLRKAQAETGPKGSRGLPRPKTTELNEGNSYGFNEFSEGEPRMADHSVWSDPEGPG